MIPTQSRGAPVGLSYDDSFQDCWPQDACVLLCMNLRIPVPIFSFLSMFSIFYMHGAYLMFFPIALKTSPFSLYRLLLLMALFLSCSTAFEHEVFWFSFSPLWLCLMFLSLYLLDRVMAILS